MRVHGVSVCAIPWEPLLAEHAQYCYRGERHASSDFRSCCVQGKSLQRALSNGARKLQEGPLKGPPAFLDDLKQKVKSGFGTFCQLMLAGACVCAACMFVPVPIGMHTHVASTAVSMRLASLATSRAPVSKRGWESSVPSTLHGTKLYGALRCPCCGVKTPVRRSATNRASSGRLTAWIPCSMLKSLRWLNLCAGAHAAV